MEGIGSSGPVSMTFSTGRSLQSVFFIKTVTVYEYPSRGNSYKVISDVFAGRHLLITTIVSTQWGFPLPSIEIVSSPVLDHGAQARYYTSSSKDSEFFYVSKM